MQRHQGSNLGDRSRTSTAGPAVAPATATPAATTPGKQTLVDTSAGASAEAAPVQRKDSGGAAPAAGSDAVHAAAARGVAGGAGALPHLDRIQRAFGRHDASGIQAHVGGPAADACRDIGAEAYASGGSVAFASAPSLHIAAHEAAHVVQQRGGVQLKGGVGEANDAYERHADAVADLVVQGKSAESALDAMAPGGGGGARAAVQRFGSREHQSLGDNATGSARYDLGGHSAGVDTTAYNRAFRLTHGDIVMLSGDFFSPRDTRPASGGGTEPDPDSLFAIAARPSRSPGQSVGTWDEVVYAIQKAVPDDPRFQPVSLPDFPDGHPWHRVTFSQAVKDAVDARYLRRAAANDEHFVAPDGTDHGPTAGDGASAGGSYRALHEAAIQMAYNEASATNANAREAAAQHFLTDNFAAGHLRTPRTSIRTHWRAIYPNFWTSIRNKIARDVATWIEANDRIGSVASVDEIYAEVRTQVIAQTASMPPMGFDDLVSLCVHDFDNEHGIWVINDIGDAWKLFGDGNLDNPDPENRTRAIAQEAVALGMADIQAAVRLGATRSSMPLTGDQLFVEVRGATHGRARPSATKYGAEQLLPRMDPSHATENGTQNWAQPDLATLWTTPVRSGSPQTFGSEMTASVQRGELHTELAGLADKFPVAQDTHVVFTVHPRRGYLEGFLARLARDPHQGIIDILATR
jgi:hypothetical protein